MQRNLPLRSGLSAMLAALVFLFAAGEVHAGRGTAGPPGERPDFQDDEQRRLIIEQRREMRRQLREQWAEPGFQPGDHHQRIRDERWEERREAWRQMAPEDRQRLREEMREMRGNRGGRPGR